MVYWLFSKDSSNQDIDLDQVSTIHICGGMSHGMFRFQVGGEWVMWLVKDMSLIEKISSTLVDYLNVHTDKRYVMPNFPDGVAICSW